MTNSWQPKRITPAHYRVCYLYWSGVPNQTGPQATYGEVAAYCGYSAEHVRRIIESDAGQDVLTQLHEKAVDTIVDVEIAAQAVAPEIFQEKVRLALRANDERVRNSACTDVLAIAGHQPIKRISIEKPNAIAERLAKLSDDEIRQQVREAIGLPPTPTVH